MRPVVMPRRFGRKSIATLDTPRTCECHPIPQGPSPPHRPHIGISGPLELLPAPSDATAKTDSARAVCPDPHLGQSTFGASPIVRTSFSNFWPQSLHWYS